MTAGIKSNTQEEMLSTYKDANKNEWYDEECQETITKRNKAWKKMLKRPTIQKKNEYNDWRREAKHICRRKKREYIEKQLKSIQEKYDRNKSRNFYIEAKTK